MISYTVFVDLVFMYSVPQRFSALFALLVSLGLGILACVSISSYLLNSIPGPISVDFYQLSM